MRNKRNIAISIPTGIGAEFGGYAGDFGYIAREFAKYFYVLINPNAVNGGILSAINQNMAYMEGYLFDEFFSGNISITPKKTNETNKIGVIFDCSIKQEILNVHLNTLNAIKMVQGIETIAIEYTKKPVGVECEIKNGISFGKLENPETLLIASQNLIKKGADAIAVVCNFNDDQDDESYSAANGVDPVGGIEAVISHLIAKEFHIPVAHAPAFNSVDIALKPSHPKVSSEMISSTYLPCIMQGLAIAPKICQNNCGEISNKNIEYLIVPYGAVGSKAVILSQKSGIKIVAVKNNTELDVSSTKMHIGLYDYFESYEQCLRKIIQK
ncbi:DUF3326 domain-containing protein [bacterium]|nr:DUF3326 domain-containing protein [bacterium]